MRGTDINVAILISTYNWKSALNLVLQSVLKQTVLPNEILIADDGSRQDTEQLIRQFQKTSPVSVKHVWQPDHGFRKSIILNKALKLTDADYIIQIDGDIVLHSRFIEDHLRYAEEGTFVQGARAILNQSLTNRALLTSEIKFNFFTPGVRNRFNSLRLPFLSFLISADEQNSENSKGCNFAFWRKDYLAINGFNNQFNGWGSEDQEFAARLINSGVKKKRLKLAAICYHLDHQCNSKAQAALNHKLCEQTIYEKRKYCMDGYAQV